MKSNKTAKIPNGVSVTIGFADVDLSGLEWNIGEWSKGDMYIYLSDKGSKDYIKRLGDAENFFCFVRDDWGGKYEAGEEGYYDKDKNVYYGFLREFRRDEEPNGNIFLNIDPDYQEHWWEDGVENGYDLILRQYLGLDKQFINWNDLPWDGEK
ncbi:hypothetical protein N9E05_04680 [Gammaproteobacteria bacterium]|nr:hypothetical protein [Gammaproteobacteria bacterium]